MNTRTIHKLNKLKRNSEKITCLTAYDASFAKIIDIAKVDIILVGDSLGTIIQGHDSTIPVTVDEIIYHTKAINRVVTYSLIISDMPFMSYATFDKALNNAELILKQGAHMIKLEGKHTKTIELLTNYGVSVCGHLGLLPQHINQIGCYEVVGKKHSDAEQLLQDALDIEAAGAKLLVLECIPANLAETITKALTIPTIGIGAGPDCDGQILVLYDLLGISLNKPPTFSKNYLDGTDSIQQAIINFTNDVKTRQFPNHQHCF